MVDPRLSSTRGDAGADPSGPGPFSIGYRVLEVDYTPPLTETTRSLRVVIWYPTDQREGEYAVYPLFSNRRTSFLNAPHAFSHPAPLLLYSHGAKVFPEMGAFMSEYFATHGWIVAAVEHLDDTLANVGASRPEEIYAWRPLDVSATLDALLTLDEGDPLSGLIDRESIAVTGHSFGGYTTFALAGAQYDLAQLQTDRCQDPESDLCVALEGELGVLLSDGFRDPRMKVALPQSSGNQDFFRDGVRAVETPTLMITATRDQANTEEGSNEPYWRTLVDPVMNPETPRSPAASAALDHHRRLSFLDAGHATFTIACEHFPTLEQDDGCGPTFTPILDAQAVMLWHSLAFLRFHLWGDEEARDQLIQGESEGGGQRPEWSVWLTP